MRLAARRLRLPARLAVILAAVIAVAAWSGGRAGQVPWRFTPSSGDYAQRATTSTRLLEDTFFNGSGLWHMCVPVVCFTKNRDWGADSLTYVLYLRWLMTRDRSVLPVMRALARTAPSWKRSDSGSSDTVMWDAVADIRDYQVTGSRIALAKAKAAFQWENSDKAALFAAGACPGIDYQWPDGRRGFLKTLETASNFLKAAILLYQITGRRLYLLRAKATYDQVRDYFMAPHVPLYTVYVFDNDITCEPLLGNYFASVNGNMIWAGAALATITGHLGYLGDAIDTAKAVQADLSDADGVFADMQADNDVVEPLVEAMYDLATTYHQEFAARWLMINAAAAAADANAAGESGRFFDGPPPSTIATAWQVNGGAALAQVAGALDPRGRPADPGFWLRAHLVTDAQTLTGTSLRIAFTGRAIAILGTVGDGCCSAGHARVFVDGTQTFNRTGIWQNMTAPSIAQPNQVLFAWRWPSAGRHVITIRPGVYDREEGGSFFSMTGYLVVG